MPARKRRRVALTDDWTQLRLLCSWPEQEAYELIRPIVLFGQSPAERAQQTGTAQRSLYRRAAVFTQLGISGLSEEHPATAGPRLPPGMREAIRDLQAEYVALGLREIATICFVRFGRRPDHHTVARILAETALPGKTPRRYPLYHQIEDSLQRRLAIIHLHAEGWSVTSIAGYLQASRPTVYATLKRFFAHDFADLADHSHARTQSVRKTDLKAIAAVRRLQENPGLGAFRIHAALKQQGILLSTRTCGRILAVNQRLYGLALPKPKPRTPRDMPFKAERCHQYWTVDIRYLDMHNLGGGMIYVISILDNFSRALLASLLSRPQDLSIFLAVLYRAVSIFGSPEALVSDSGSIFKAKEAQRIYAALGIQKEQIELGQPWQSYIETHFNVQRRMADWHVGKAKTWEELQSSHARWMVDYNDQEHWAHLKRADVWRSPGEVLGSAKGKTWSPEALEPIFRRARDERRVNDAGYVRFRQWAMYGERGLAHQRVAVWLGLDAETLTIARSEELLAQYTVVQEGDRRHLKSVTPLRLFDTRFRSAQLFLWEPQDGEQRLAVYHPRPNYSGRQLQAVGEQLRLFTEIAV